MRITGGSLCGRVIAAPSGRATRPTTDKVREALFAVLGSFDEECVADLFAGSGALGIEALSRGARYACFVEVAAPACRVISRNLASLGVSERAGVLQIDLARARRPLLSAGPFDTVFCDPPWAKLEHALALITKLSWNELLVPQGRLCIEHPARDELELDLPNQLVRISTRRWGDTAVSIWERVASGTSDSGEPGDSSALAPRK